VAIIGIKASAIRTCNKGL